MDIDSGSLRISRPIFWAQFRQLNNCLPFLSKSTGMFFDAYERANRRLNRHRNHPMQDLSSLVFTKMKRREYALYRWNVPSWSIVPYRDLTKEVDWESRWDQQGMSFCLGEFIGLRRALVLFEWKERLLGWETNDGQCSRFRIVHRQRRNDLERLTMDICEVEKTTADILPVHQRWDGWLEIHQSCSFVVRVIMRWKSTVNVQVQWWRWVQCNLQGM